MITAGVTLTGALLTLLYSVLRDRYERKRHSRQIELDERRAKLEEAKLALELYNLREAKIFEARLETYRDVFVALMPLAKREIKSLTPEQALAIEQNLKEVFYYKVSHCMSTDSIEKLTKLRDALLEFADGNLTTDDILKARLELLQSLHRDLGRTGSYLGDNPPLLQIDTQVTENYLRSQK